MSAFSVPKPLVNRAWMLVYSTGKQQCCKVFLSGYSFPFSSQLAGGAVFPLPGSDLPACPAAGRSRLAGATPAGERVLDVRGTGSGWQLEGCQRWVVFPLLINKRQTSSCSPLECVFAVE